MPDFIINQKPQLPNRPRPIVSIGVGGIVHDAHYPAYRKAGFPIVALYDPNQERAQHMAQQFDVPTIFDSLQDAATHAPADAIFDVAVPAKALVELLPHLPDHSALLIQKPMGESLDEARQILALCRQKQFTAAVNFQMRWAPFVLAARSLIEQGAIGELCDLEVRLNVYTPWQLWPFLQVAPYSEIMYHSIHYIDLMRSFLGEPNGVYAKTVRHPKLLTMNGSRTTIIFDYGDVTRCNVETNHHHEYGLRHQESYIKWEGTQGAIKVTMGLLLDYPKGKPDSFEYCLLRQDEEPIWEPLAIAGSWFPDAFIGSMGSLMAFVEGSIQVLPTSVEDAYKTMQLADAICRSSDSGATKIRE